MNHNKICLASENFSPVHPLVMEAVIQANVGTSPSYGLDRWTQEAERVIQEAFKAKPKVFMTPTGTGANILALKLGCRRYESVICSNIAHMQYQESGAAESIVGCKLLSISHEGGKITPEAILQKIKRERAFGKHSTAPRLLSITQPTEVGTVYSREELKALATLCKEEKLLLHVDGSRISNALAFLNCSFHDLLHMIPIDVLSLGGTKNGLMGAEALLIFNPALAEGSDHVHKQTLQLLSKMRYLSAQFVPFFQNDLWLKMALHANKQAQKLAQMVKTIPELSLSYPVETNQLFFTAPAAWIPQIQERIACILWESEKNELRWITSWSTTKKEIEDVHALFCSDFFGSDFAVRGR